MAANGRREQRADAIGEGGQRCFCIGYDRSAPGKNERPLRALDFIGERPHGCGIGLQATGFGRQCERRKVRRERRVLHVAGQTEHDRPAVAQRTGHRAQGVGAGARRGVDALGYGADRTRELRLLEVEVRLHGARRHVASEYDERCPALRGLRDAGDCVREPGAGMHAHERELARGLRVSISHGRSAAFMAGGDQLDAGFDERVGNLEIRGAEQAEAAARAVTREILRDDRGDCRLGFHRMTLRHYLMSRPGSQVAIAGTKMISASSRRLMQT